MKKFLRWYRRLALLEKALLVILPTVIIGAILAIRLVTWGYLNRGMETPLPLVSNKGEVNIDTFQNSGYRIDSYRNEHKKKESDTLDLLRSEIVPFSPIARRDRKVNVIDDRQNETAAEPVETQNAYYSYVPDRNIPLETTTDIPDRGYDPYRPAPAAAEDYYVPKPIVEVTGNDKPDTDSQRAGSSGFNIMRAGGGSLQGMSENGLNLNVGETPIKAVVNGNQTITNDSRLTVKTIEDGELNGLKIPKGTVLHAKAMITDKRINAYVERVVLDKKVFPIALTLCDLDLQEGITYNMDKSARRSATRDAAGNILDRAIGTVTGGIISSRDATQVIQGVDKDAQVPLTGGREIYLISI